MGRRAAQRFMPAVQTNELFLVEIKIMDEKTRAGVRHRSTCSTGCSAVPPTRYTRDDGPRAGTVASSLLSLPGTMCRAKFIRLLRGSSGRSFD